MKESLTIINKRGNITKITIPTVDIQDMVAIHSQKTGNCRTVCLRQKTVAKAFGLKWKPMPHFQTVILCNNPYVSNHRFVNIIRQKTPNYVPIGAEKGQSVGMSAKQSYVASYP